MMENFDKRSSTGNKAFFSSNEAPVPGNNIGFTDKNRVGNDPSFKDYIKSNLKSPKVSQEFIQSIKDKIRLV
jgi:hypothetical protein